jgi:predicted double-glycine peptidase
MKHLLSLVNASVLVVSALGQVAFAQSIGSSSRIQPDEMCGPKCLLVVCQRLGVRADLDELAGLCCRGENPTTMADLCRAAREKGLKATGSKIRMEDLATLGVPAIAHLWGNHFVVVQCASTDLVEVTDPPAEPRVVPLEEFKKMYSGFALLVAKDESAFPKPEANGPDLRFDSYNYDFGFIEQGEQAVHTFVYENKGNEELVLSKAETGCGCTHAFLSEQRRVPPGGKGDLLVGFDSTGRQGGQSQIVYVHSNDPISPIVQLDIGGVIKPVRVPISVRSLHFGSVKKRSGATREFSIKDPGDGSLAVNEVTCDSPFVNVSLACSVTKPWVYLVRASLQPGVPIGELKCKITVRTNHPKEPVVEVPVTVDVTGDVEASPNMFFLGLLKKGEGVSKTITLSTTSDEPLTIRKIDAPFDYVVVKALPQIEGKKYTVTATLKETAPLGLIKGEITIHTNNQDQPEIKLPVYALVEE